MIKDNLLLVGFIVALLLMVIIVNIKECGKPAPPDPDPIEEIDSIELRIDTIQITKIKTITKLKTKIQYEKQNFTTSTNSVFHLYLVMCSFLVIIHQWIIYNVVR